MILQKKLIKNYLLSEKSTINKYLPSKSAHWIKFNKNKIINEKNITNFRKSGLSNGLDDKAGVKDTFENFIKIKNIVGEDFINKNILKKNIGNSDKIFSFKNVFIDNNQLILLYWYNIIKKYISQKKVVCEIGGGFGQFAELILKNNKVKFISIDLPFSNLLTSYYLKKNFPKKKFFLFENYQKKKIVTKKDLIKNDILILPPNCNFEKGLEINFFINMRSMMEMSKFVINSYFDFIQTHASKDCYFFNLNRFHKKIGNEIISLENYNYDKNWNVLRSGKSFNQPWIYYILSKRKFKKFSKNIKVEQKKIKELGKEFKIASNFFIVKYRLFLTLLTTLFIRILFKIFSVNFLKRVAARLLNFKN